MRLLPISSGNRSSRPSPARGPTPGRDVQSSSPPGVDRQQEVGARSRLGVGSRAGGSLVVAVVGRVACRTLMQPPGWGSGRLQKVPLSSVLSVESRAGRRYNLPAGGRPPARPTHPCSSWGSTHPLKHGSLAELGVDPQLGQHTFARAGGRPTPWPNRCGPRWR